MFAKDVTVVEALLRHPKINVNIQDKVSSCHVLCASGGICIRNALLP